jgi:eukaryotic-like serine/threonine-protein kinase
MGEVFKARDTRLERSVAIKVLAGGAGDRTQWQARFEREARTISQLNHPHICTVDDFGREDGISYLVMELLEGETVAERLRRGPLPLADVLRFGSQVADALERAHRAGIVHRDLKPGNIMITRSGAKLPTGWEDVRPRRTTFRSHSSRSMPVRRPIRRSRRTGGCSPSSRP